MHDMSREFWHALAFVLLVSAIVAPITGWYLDFGGFFVFSSFLGCIAGAAYMPQLDNTSDPRKNRSE
jgi:membrane protein implicated in regulation of membrane protease activity